MRILYYFPNHETVMFQWQKYHIFDELKKHGCEFKIVNPSAFSSNEQANEALISQVKNHHFDMFFTSMNRDCLKKETLDYIKQVGIPTVLFCPDNLVAPFNHEFDAADFDLVWLTSVETEYLYKSWGCKTIFLPYAANPDFMKPVIVENEIQQIGFIGTPHGSRVDRINTLLVAGIPVTIHTNSNGGGRGLSATPESYLSALKNYMRYPIGRKLAVASVIDKLGHRTVIDEKNCLTQKAAVPLDQLSKLNGTYSLILSFTDATSTGVLKKPVPIVNLRNFEIPMSGGLQFTTYSDEIASYFEPEKEIILCRSKEEYIDKAKFYLRDEQCDVRNKIRAAARLRAENEHTWWNRFTALFEELGVPY